MYRIQSYERRLFALDANQICLRKLHVDADSHAGSLLQIPFKSGDVRAKIGKEASVRVFVAMTNINFPYFSSH